MNSEYFWIKLSHNGFDFHDDKFKHWIRIDVFVFSKKYSYPSQSLRNSNKVMSMNLVSIQGEQNIWNTSISGYELENSKKYFL